ncbi:GlxA family transcriptional regulator [Bradyrhizobium sp. CCBAU 53421]|uniref:GlxA family transcriptional regulator n=1 Tax=Bradyrhizobium sp. CCBAU 53421 TaxID=1325120 RepID=UPI00188ABC67|nr:helix-turn-helix domain-containing protein [Bradyrhizobium sp. CCBAU 53421]
MIKVDILVPESSSPAALGITLDVLDAVNRLAGEAVFGWRAVVTEGSTAQLRGGVSLPAQPLSRARPRDLAIVLGMGAGTDAEIEHRVVAPDAPAAAKWLRSAWHRGTTIAASCTGVFLLGMAGLLDGRRCTTTWWLTPKLKALFPESLANADCMLTEDSRIWTAGASFAHIDLMLGLVARFAGPSLAEDAARHVVVDQRASQARYVIPAFLAAQDPIARKVEAYVRRSLKAPFSLRDLAKQTGTTTRTLNRRLVLATGLSPMRFVQKIRVDAALHLLQTTRLPLEDVAEEVGFDDTSALYRLIRRHTGKSPGKFRA